MLTFAPFCLGVMQEDKQKGSRFCVWITSEPCPRITDFLIRNLHKVSWSHITQDVITPEGGTADEGGKVDAPFTIQHKSPQSYLHSGTLYINFDTFYDN